MMPATLVRSNKCPDKQLVGDEPKRIRSADGPICAGSPRACSGDVKAACPRSGPTA